MFPLSVYLVRFNKLLVSSMKFFLRITKEEMRERKFLWVQCFSRVLHVSEGQTHSVKVRTIMHLEQTAVWWKGRWCVQLHDFNASNTGKKWGYNTTRDICFYYMRCCIMIRARTDTDILEMMFLSCHGLSFLLPKSFFFVWLRYILEF